MISFRAQVAKDFDAVFLNQKEFGHACRWNDIKLRYAKAVMDDEMVEDALGVNRELLRIICKKTDLKPMPVPGEEILFDGERWEVMTVQAPLCHLVITLWRNVS